MSPSVLALRSTRSVLFTPLAIFILPLLVLMSAARPAVAQSNANIAPPQTLPALPPLSQPLIEVAAFRVAPVKLDTQSILNKGVTNGNRFSPSTQLANTGAIETRVQAAEAWIDVLQRVNASLNLPMVREAITAQLGLLPQLLPGKFLRARALADNLMEIEYVVQPSEAYTIAIHGDVMQVRPHADPRLIERMLADPAKASLFTATNAIGLPESIALQLTEIFAGEVDFHRELHLGYRCALVYEANYREGFIEKSGRILAVELEIGNRRFQAYYTQDAQGRGAYFDASGKTTRRMFRRSPVEFTQITSDYNLARFHPILGIWRAHRGVDYAAPMGAKVMAVAEGVAEFVGARSDFGNLVVVRHQEVFMTYYAHLSEFAPGLLAGNKVEQGQTLGLVGMTGLATGPHLHFEFHRRDAAGVWSAIPAPNVIETTVVAAPGFADLVNSYRTRLTVAETNLVVLD